LKKNQKHGSAASSRARFGGGGDVAVKKEPGRREEVEKDGGKEGEKNVKDSGKDGGRDGGKDGGKDGEGKGRERERAKVREQMDTDRVEKKVARTGSAGRYAIYV